MQYYLRAQRKRIYVRTFLAISGKKVSAVQNNTVSGDSFLGVFGVTKDLELVVLKPGFRQTNFHTNICLAPVSESADPMSQWNLIVLQQNNAPCHALKSKQTFSTIKCRRFNRKHHKSPHCPTRLLLVKPFKGAYGKNKIVGSFEHTKETIN